MQLYFEKINTLIQDALLPLANLHLLLLLDSPQFREQQPALGWEESKSQSDFLLNAWDALYKSTQIRDPAQSLHHWQRFTPPSLQCCVPTGPLRCWNTNKCRIQATETYWHTMIWFLTLPSLKQKLQRLRNRFWFSSKHNTITFISSFFLIYSSYASAISHSESQEKSQQKKGSCFVFIFPSSNSSDWKLH